MKPDSYKLNRDAAKVTDNTWGLGAIIRDGNKKHGQFYGALSTWTQSSGAKSNFSNGIKCIEFGTQKLR